MKSYRAYENIMLDEIYYLFDLHNDEILQLSQNGEIITMITKQKNIKYLATLGRIDVTAIGLELQKVRLTLKSPSEFFLQKYKQRIQKRLKGSLESKYSNLIVGRSNLKENVTRLKGCIDIRMSNGNNILRHGVKNIVSSVCIKENNIEVILQPDILPVIESILKRDRRTMVNIFLDNKQYMKVPLKMILGRKLVFSNISPNIQQSYVTAIQNPLAFVNFIETVKNNEIKNRISKIIFLIMLIGFFLFLIKKNKWSYPILIILLFVHLKIFTYTPYSILSFLIAATCLYYQYFFLIMPNLFISSLLYLKFGVNYSYDGLIIQQIIYGIFNLFVYLISHDNKAL